MECGTLRAAETSPAILPIRIRRAPAMRLLAFRRTGRVAIEFLRLASLARAVTAPCRLPEARDSVGRLGLGQAAQEGARGAPR